VWKRNKGEGVMDKTSIFFLSTQTETEGTHRGGLTVVAGGLPGHSGGQEWGNRERRSRATHSSPHLRLGRLVEGDRRWRADRRPRHH
jgi:hypothetical protein